MANFNIKLDDISDEIRAGIIAFSKPIENAAIRAMTTVSTRLKDLGRANIEAGGLGSRYAKAWHIFNYFKNSPKTDAAVLATVAARYAEIFEEGGTVTPSHGKYLWIPLKGAPKGAGGKHVSPGDLGVKLTMLKRAGKVPLLATQLKVGKGFQFGAPLTSTYIRSHQSKNIAGRTVAPKSRQQRVTVPLFFGLLRVYLKKRTDLLAIAQEQQDALPTYFQNEINKEDGVE